MSAYRSAATMPDLSSTRPDHSIELATSHFTQVSSERILKESSISYDDKFEEFARIWDDTFRFNYDIKNSFSFMRSLYNFIPRMRYDISSNHKSIYDNNKEFIVHSLNCSIQSKQDNHYIISNSIIHKLIDFYLYILNNILHQAKWHTKISICRFTNRTTNIDAFSNLLCRHTDSYVFISLISKLNVEGIKIYIYGAGGNILSKFIMRDPMETFIIKSSTVEFNIVLLPYLKQNIMTYADFLVMKFDRILKAPIKNLMIFEE